MPEHIRVFSNHSNRQKKFTCSVFNSECFTGPTMKLKRPVVLKMYKEQIENFYKELVTPTTPDNPLPPK